MDNQLKRSVFSRREFVAGMTAAAATLPFVSQLEAAATKRPICVFSKHLQWCKSFDEMAEIAAEIGFDGIDLTVRNGGHVQPEDVVKKLPQAVKAVEKVGLKVYMMTAGLHDPNDKWTEPVLKTAGEMGIGFYRMGYMNYDKKVGVANSLPKLREQITKLAQLNKQYNIHGAYQNHAGARVGGPVWDIWELIKDLDPKWIGCQYDIRHATVEGATSWPLGFELLKNHTKIIAVKDFKWAQVDGKWKAGNVPLGKGMVDFDSYFAQYKKYNVEGPISLHYEYPLGGANSGKRKITISQDYLKAAMKADLAWLRNKMKSSGLK